MTEIRSVTITPQSVSTGQQFIISVDVYAKVSITDLLNVSINKLKTIAINVLKGGG